MPGTYHFRFKSPLIPGSDREKNAVAVWMDCVDDDQHVSVWRNTIVAKVTRINMDDDEDDDDFAQHRNGSSHHAHSNTAPAPAPPRAPPQHSSPRPSSRPAPSPPAPVQAAPNLLGFDDPEPAPSSAPLSNGSLLDDNHLNAQPSSRDESLLNLNDTSSYNTNLQHQSSHDDFLGMTSTPITTTTAAPAPTPVAPAPSSYGMPQRNNSANANGGKPGKAFDTFANQSGPFGGLKW